MSELNLPRIVIAQEITDDQVRGIRELQKEAYHTCLENGFAESFENIPQQAMMIVTEVAEFIQELRESKGPYAISPLGFKLRLAEELADIVIRTLSLAEHMELDLGAAVNQKMHDNKSREYMHGKAF